MAQSIPAPDELDKLAVMDPEIAELVKQIPQSWQPKGDDPVELVRQMRAGYDNMPLTPPLPEVRESQSTYTTRDGTELRLCVFEPKSTTVEPLPLFVWYHGGGGCIGRPEASAPLCRTIALDHRCVVVAPQYRLGPEHKFPTGVEDSWDALNHVAARASDLDADPSVGFVIGGESAGAVIAAVLALQARDETLNPPLTGIFLSAGSYFNPKDIPEKYKDAYRSRNDPACINSPMLSKPVKAAFDACLQGDYSSPFFKAALWPTGRKGLPKTYLQTCGMDINRDDGIMYADLLSKAGVQTKLDMYPGGPHCFWHLFGDTEMGSRWVKDTKDGLRWLFGETTA